MKKNDLQGVSEAELVERFAAIGVQQDNVLLQDEYARFNELFDKKEAIKAEFRSRPGDRRVVLLSLF